MSVSIIGSGGSVEALSKVKRETAMHWNLTYIPGLHLEACHSLLQRVRELHIQYTTTSPPPSSCL